MDEKLEGIKDVLKKYGQEHLLNEYERLDNEKKQELLKQIENLDFELIKNLYDNREKEISMENSDIKPIDYLDKYKLGDKLKYYEEIGARAIKEGKLAAVTMAGGQGTRLGHNGPKGTFDIGLDSHKSLFELLSVPWFIMTSEENHKETVEFFRSHSFFGYDENKTIFFFKQGKLPMVDTEGKILIGEDGLIRQAADGHGGVYCALLKDGMIDKMKQMGIEWIYIGGVDNCLAKIVDPVFLGIAIDKGVIGASKSVVKANPKEKAGVFCKKNGRPSIIEYTEISDEMAEATDENGELLYGEANILCHVFKIEAIEKMAEEPLPYHSAFKKATYIDQNGNKVVPNSPNAYKFEAFLFDAFGELDDMAVVRVKREEEFAPVKNAEGVDSPETARELYKKLYNC